MTLQCEKCGAYLRTARVEQGMEEVDLYVICPNKRCEKFRMEVFAKQMKKKGNDFYCSKIRSLDIEKEFMK